MQAINNYAADVLRGLIQIKAAAGCTSAQCIVIKRTAIRLGLATGLPAPAGACRRQPG
jgi:hypothetical protein